LRDLKTGGTSVTSSGDTAGDTISNYVVQVRRSSDDTIKSFTADSITNGDLLSFVNEHHIVYSSDFSSDVNSFSALDGDSISRIDSFGGEDNVLKFQVGTGSSSHRITRTGGLIANEKMNFSIKVYIPSSNAEVNSVLIRDASSNVVISSTTPASDQWVTLSAENLTNITNNVLRIRFQKDGSNFTGNNTDVAYIKDIVTTQVTADGHVATWYDQSGNDKHATQSTTTYQPKIVDSGSLLTDGGLLFDGDDTFLDSGSSTSLGTEFFVTGVMNLNTPVDDNAAIITNAEAGGGDRLFVGSSGDTLRIRDDSTNIDSSLVLSKTADNLFTYQASASSFTFVKNGTTDAKSALSGGQSYRYIGGGSGFNLSANIKELIIYASDVSEKRRAIEESIATNYSITLASFSRDGMVRTWYDQSVSDQGSTATGNHAVQATAANQPKVVSNGSLVSNGEVDFDGTDDCP
jgi:hypothetical protein